MGDGAVTTYVHRLIVAVAIIALVLSLGPPVSGG